MLFEKAVKNQVARQDSRHRGLEESRDAKHAYSLKASTVNVLKKAGMRSMHTVLQLARLMWTGHFIRMPDERLLKKVFYRELQDENALSRWP